MMEMIMDEEQIPELRVDVHKCIYTYKCVSMSPSSPSAAVYYLSPQHHIHCPLP